MNINTKFNIGDTVYTISDRLELSENKYCITMIKIIIDSKNTVNILYFINDKLFRENQVFAAREEAFDVYRADRIKHLNKKYGNIINEYLELTSGDKDVEKEIN
jgi:hypothetical protein